MQLKIKLIAHALRTLQRYRFNIRLRYRHQTEQPTSSKKKIREKCLYYMYQLKIVLRSLYENFKILSKCPLYDLPEFSLCKMARNINRIVNFTNIIVESSFNGRYDELNMHWRPDI